MKKVLMFLCCCILSILYAQAQMSDEQVIDYVKSQHESGVDQNQIAKDLLSKGVTPDQLKRIRAEYESKGNAPAAAANKTVDRLRKPNGQTEPEEVELPEVESEKKIFGHDIFKSENLTFQSNMNIPAPATYLLGPGDEIIVDIYGATQISNTLTVAPDGSVTIPDERPVYVAGLTLSQAQAKVRSAIGANYSESTVKLSLGQTRTVLVNVMGEVVRPGTYSLSAFSTVFNALYLAGGINEIGTLRNVKVSRKGKIITTVDVYEFILNGRLPGNVMLQDDDVIIVGTYESLVSIEGKVKRPMYYEMKKGETLKSLLHYAGGFTGDAYKEKVRVERRSSDGLTVHNIDEWDFAQFHHEDEDVVVVAPIIERYKNMVKVSGAVFRPGNYKLGEKANTIKSAVEQAGGLIEQAVTSRAVLLRMKEDRTLTTITVPLQDILDGNQQDIILQNEDELVISSYENIASARTMSIFGEVQNPGAFDFSENTTVGDLITMAGGLKEGASLDKIEVSRRIVSAKDNEDGYQLAKVYILDLDNNLQVKGDDQFVLEPYDRITVHRSPNYKTPKAIYIGGEVQYEGWYTLSNKNEKLSTMIDKAGGLTAKADASAAKLLRKYTIDEMRDRQQLLEMAETYADSVIANKEIRKTNYRVGIDLAEAMAKPAGNRNIVLEEGDSIYVPQQSDVVKVSGEVLSPNTVTFIQGKSATYYINQAGGVSENGKKSKAYILYANGQASTLKRGKIKPGCEIIVPHKVEKKIDSAKVSMWATLASTTATVGAVISNIVR